MRIGAHREESMAEIRRVAAVRAEELAYAAELEVERLTRIGASDLPGAAAARERVPAAREAARIQRARATLRNRGVLDDDAVRAQRASFLDRYMLQLEKDHLRIQYEIDARTEEMELEEDEDEAAAVLQQLRDELLVVDLVHAMCKELRAPLRGNRAQRRAASKRKKSAG